MQSTTRGGRALMFAALVLLLRGTAPSASQAGSQNLSDLVQRLELTSQGADTWLKRLGVRVGASRQIERLLFVDRNGTTLLTEIGDLTRVPLTAKAAALLNTEGGSTVVVHNHPGSAGLSGMDLLYLVKRGVTAVAAVGHDGSVYVAAAGPRYAGYTFLRDQYRVACAELDTRLSFYLHIPEEASWRRLSGQVPFAHLVSRALEQASVIEYRADLSPSTRAASGRIAAECDEAVAAATRVLTGSQRARPVRVVRDNVCGELS